MAVNLRALLAILAAAVALPGVAVESLSDPTRPPPGYASGDDQALAEGDGASSLQSVLMPKGGRPSAIINGQLVRLGDRLGEARLTKISENEAVLQGPNGIEHLFLTPEARKVAAPVPAIPAKRKKERP